MDKWIFTKRKNRVIPNGPIPEYVVHKESIPNGICVCFTELAAKQVADALNKEAFPMMGLEIRERKTLQSDWRKCSEQMPDDDTLVLIYTANDAMHVASHDGHNWWDAERFIIGAAVTHWCDPVPPAANEMFNHEETKNTKEIN